MTDRALPAHLDGLLTGFVDDLRNRTGDNLKSVTLYGSAARGDFVEGVSDINVLIVAHALPVEALRAAGDAARRWRQRLPLSPIFATEDYLTQSADVFPLEFLDMRDAHFTLYGQDPLAGLAIDPRMLRHQVEAELKGKLMRLRTAYAGAADHPLAVRDLLRSSLTSFRVLFQGALRLAGETPPRQSADVMRAVSRVFGLDARTLEEAVAVQHKQAPTSDLDGLFGRYLAAIERLVAIVDTWDEGTVDVNAPRKEL